MRTRFQHFFSFEMRVRLQGTFGRPRRRNICAPRPILDGRRLGNHPFYRCPLKDSCAHAAPECRARPRRRRPSRPGCPRSQRRRRRGGASDRARRQGCRRGGASGRASLPSTAVATARRRRFRPGTTPRLPGPRAGPERPQGRAVVAVRPESPPCRAGAGPWLSPRRCFRPGTAGAAALPSPHTDSCRARLARQRLPGRPGAAPKSHRMPRA